MKEKDILNLIIVGEVDHGKSTLIGRLLYDTGSIPEDRIKSIQEICQSFGKEMEFSFLVDHLKEEREKEMTIDTAQVFIKSKKRDYVIIDAPGHKEFIKNMLTGASQAEAGIIIVDANVGIGEQTQRHSFLLKLLGIKQIIVAVNKMDLVDFSEKKFNEIKSQFEKFLSQIKLPVSFFIPISAKEGDNVAERSKRTKWYKGETLIGALEKFPPAQPLSQKPFRFAVQDVYSFDEKEIIVGKVLSGEVKINQKGLALPSKRKIEIKSIEIFGEERKKAEAEESIGLTIKEKVFFDRGEVISDSENLPLLSSKFLAYIFWTSKNKANLEDEFLLSLGTQTVKAKFKEIRKRIDSATLKILEKNAKKIEENEVGEVVIETEKPIVFERFNFLPPLGRFVIFSQVQPEGGGIIISPLL